jgi:hypothetical protein
VSTMPSLPSCLARSGTSPSQGGHRLCIRRLLQFSPGELLHRVGWTPSTPALP